MRHSILVTTFLAMLVINSYGQEAKTDQSAATTSLKNHHMLLVPSGAPGNGEVFWIAVAPDGQLSILPVSQLQTKMSEGYRPFTFGEFQDALTMMVNQNAALTAEVKRLEGNQVNTSRTATDRQEAAAALAEVTRRAEAQRRDEQRRQAILMFLMGQQTQKINMNVNVTDCTKYPALCVNH